jgi:hypothetical protein
MKMLHALRFPVFVLILSLLAGSMVFPLTACLACEPLVGNTGIDSSGISLFDPADFEEDDVLSVKSGLPQETVLAAGPASARPGNFPAPISRRTPPPKHQ